MTDEIDETTADDASAPVPVSRRAALKVIGAVPIAGALVGGAAFAQQGTTQAPQQPKQTHEGPTQPARGPATNPPDNAPKRVFFTAAEWRTVECYSDSRARMRRAHVVRGSGQQTLRDGRLGRIGGW